MSIPRFNITALRQSIQKQQSETKRDIFRSVAMDVWANERNKSEKQKNNKNKTPRFEPGHVYLNLDWQVDEEDAPEEQLSSFLEDNLSQEHTENAVQEILKNEINFEVLSYEYDAEYELYSVWHKSKENVYDVLEENGIAWEESEDYMVETIKDFYGNYSYIVPPIQRNDV